MKETEKNRTWIPGLQRHSLAAKTIRSTFLSCLLLAAVALVIGLFLYGLALTNQTIRHASDMSRFASLSVGQGPESKELATQIMDIYHSLTPEEKQKTGTEEYRAHFTEFNENDNEAFRDLKDIMNVFLSSGETEDVYLGMFDRKDGVLVYILDPSDTDHFEPGEWESLTKREISTFLDWDGNGRLYDVDYSKKYGWMCTAGTPVRDSATGEPILFVLTDVSINNVINAMKGYALQVSLGLLAVSLLLGWLLTKRIRKRIVTPINAIADAAVAYVHDRRAGSQKTDHFDQLGIHTKDEIENLSLIMADMERDLTDHEEQLTRITAEKERIGSELHTAAQIQSAMLPHDFPPFPGRREFDLFASMNPAKEVGGDFYDYFLIDDDHLCLVMADVSGKGIPAALFMMASKILLKSYARLGESPARILTSMNNTLCAGNQVQMFVTVWLGILEISTGQMVCANAGHEYPAFRRPGGGFSLYRDKHDFVVGGMEGMHYREYTLQIEPGSSLFIYTDGITEATNAREQLFGTGRMLEALNRDPDASAQDILKNVHDAVDAFVTGCEQFDDMTMLCIRYFGKPAGGK